MNQLQTISEDLFAKYLASLKLVYDYEKDWGGKRSDFTVYKNADKTEPLVITDTKELDYSEAEKRILKNRGILVRNVDPYSRIREKINAARKQFKFAKEYLCIPIIYRAGGAPVIPLIVFAAMLGDLGMSIPIRVGGGIDKERKSQSFFGKGGKMIDEKHMQPQNTTIAAVGILGNLEPEAILSGYHEELQKRTKDIVIKSQEWLEKTINIDNQLKEELRKKGYKNLHETVPYVDFIVNPYSKFPFPQKFFRKGYTYIYEYNLETGEIKLTYDWRIARHNMV